MYEKILVPLDGSKDNQASSPRIDAGGDRRQAEYQFLPSETIVSANGMVWQIQVQ
jgi:hypothetical protein